MEILPASIEEGFPALPGEVLKLAGGVRIKTLTRRRLAADLKATLDLRIDLSPDCLDSASARVCAVQFTGKMAGAIGQIFRRDFRIDAATGDCTFMARHHDDRTALIVLLHRIDVREGRIQF